MVENLNLQSESTLTDRYQTTIPSSVRKALCLNKIVLIIFKPYCEIDIVNKTPETNIF